MYREAISPALNRLDSETWQHRARMMLNLVERNPFLLKVVESAFNSKRLKDNRLNVTIGGIELENPTMVGAGWDKVGEAVAGLHALGFSGVEVGAVLPRPQIGNPKPRQWVLNQAGDVALNRRGFDSPGMAKVAENLARYRGSGIPIGINVGINKEVTPDQAPNEYASVVRKLYPFGDFFTVNVSSPNTPGLRALQDKKPLTDILQAVQGTMGEIGQKKPLFVKIAPDLSERDVTDVIDVALQEGLTGIVATNTTNNPEIKGKYGTSPAGKSWADEAGGLSGNDAVFRKMATEKVAQIYKEAGDRLQIIGVGGINNAATALEKIYAGANALQVVTGIRGEGPFVARNINLGILDFLNQQGILNLEAIRGAGLK